jgi:hypothetical protein
VRCHPIVTGVVPLERARREDSKLTLLVPNDAKLVDIAGVYGLNAVEKAGNLGSG